MRLNIGKGLAELKRLKLAELNDIYVAAMNGVDKVTGKQIYVNCIVAENTFKMNAGYNAAQTLDAGIRLAAELGAPVMNQIRDFHNGMHPNIPIEIARAIRVQQALHATTIWERKGQLKDLIDAATTVAELKAVELTFPMVNVE